MNVRKVNSQELDELKSDPNFMMGTPVNYELENMVGVYFTPDNKIIRIVKEDQA